MRHVTHRWAQSGYLFQKPGHFFFDLLKDPSEIFFYPLSTFNETIVTALTSYFQHRPVMSGFIHVFQKRWTLANPKQYFHPNQLDNGAVRENIFNFCFHSSIPSNIGE